MVVYDKNNIMNMYLSPYLKFAWDETGVTVYQIVFCRALRIEAKREKLEIFFTYLKQGITMDRLQTEIRKLLPKADPNLFLTQCIRNGVIE